MKKMKLILALLIMTFAVACGQKADDTFNKPVYFNYPVYLNGGFWLNGIFYSTIPTGSGTVNWADILNKPLVFAPSAHGHKWSEITEKPDTIGLQAAIESLGYLPIPGRTTTEINTIIVPTGKSGIVKDKTIDCYKIWANGLWKTIITNQ